jgi:hypothetical protein
MDTNLQRDQELLILEAAVAADEENAGVMGRLRGLHSQRVEADRRQLRPRNWLRCTARQKTSMA